MISKNYKKVAIINITQHIEVQRGSSFSATGVKFNLTFSPSLIFVRFENSANGVFKDIMSSKEHYSQSKHFSRSSLVTYITNVTKAGFNFNAKSDSGDWVEIKQIIAIE